MNNDEKQAFLSRYKGAVLELKCLDEPEDKLCREVYAASQSLRRKKEAQRQEAARIVETCERAVAAVQNDVQRAALELHFLKGYTWAAVAEELQYSDVQTYRIRRAALSALQL